MTRPNFLVICVDHWPGSLLGSEEHPAVMTPTLDQLAANGIRYNRAYSGCPVCIPARRGLMTGTMPRTHGDRIFNESLEMDPNLPTLAQTFSDAGYQTYAVGKLHVYPQRDRIGFHDVILNEEGRHHLGMRADDYELMLAEEGFAGQEYVHGMPTTDYITRPWHLPEHLHHTNWTVREMSRLIQRRDPKRPALWYMSFNFPHPPLVPLPAYLDLYHDVPIPDRYVGEWAEDFDALPYAMQFRRDFYYARLNPPDGLRDFELRQIRRAFYAQCTHIDHQIRLLIGLLREEKLLDSTTICFTSDHGDMLGNHGFYAKGMFYEDSTRVPLILVPPAAYARAGHHQVDDRLAELCDIMPTLLDLAGIPIPVTVDGHSLLSDETRSYLYGEFNLRAKDELASRMLRSDHYKLIYYPTGNRTQLFDMVNDPQELHDLTEDPAYSEVRAELEHLLITELYGADLDWIENDRLVGLPDREYTPAPNRGLTAQRGWRFI